MWFIQYLRCQKHAINKCDENYMLVGDYVFFNWDEDIVPMGDSPPLLNEKVLAKY